jgi:hypothetical protein
MQKQLTEDKKKSILNKYLNGIKQRGEKYES